MAFANSNDYLDGRKPVPTSESGHKVLATRFEIQMATGDLDLNDIGVLGILPAGHIPVGALMDADDLDSNGVPALVHSIGIGNLALKDAAGAASADAANTLISTTTVDGGAAWGTGITVGQAGGQVQVLSKALSRVQAVSYDRYIVGKVTTAAATAAAGKLGLTLQYRPA